MPEPLSPAHAPCWATDTPLRPATQAVEYVLPSQPHTGANSMVHRSGMGLQVPDMSPAPHLAEGANEQYCFSGQRTPAMPPHSLPVGAAEPELAGTAELVGAGVADPGAGGGSGAELTTPVGVSTGIGGALEAGAGLAGAVETGA